MKKVLVFALFLSLGAFAGVTKMDNAFGDLQYTLQGLGGNHFEGDSCIVEARKLDATTIRLVYTDDSGREITFYAHQDTLKGTTRSNGSGDYVSTYTEKNGNKVIITVADDAYDVISFQSGTQRLNCQRDM